MGFKDKISKTFNAAADKSAELAGTAKVKLDITNKKSSIKSNYSELGESVYKASKSEIDNSEEIKRFCDAIDQLNQEIEALEESLIK